MRFERFDEYLEGNVHPLWHDQFENESQYNTSTARLRNVLPEKSKVHSIPGLVKYIVYNLKYYSYLVLPNEFKNILDSLEIEYVDSDEGVLQIASRINEAHYFNWILGEIYFYLRFSNHPEDENYTEIENEYGVSIINNSSHVFLTKREYFIFKELKEERNMPIKSPKSIVARVLYKFRKSGMQIVVESVGRVLLNPSDLVDMDRRLLSSLLDQKSKVQMTVSGYTNIYFNQYMYNGSSVNLVTDVYNSFWLLVSGYDVDYAVEKNLNSVKSALNFFQFKEESRLLA